MSTAAKVLSPFFIFAVSFAFIFAVLLPIFVTGQGEAVNSRIVTLTEPTLLYFHFYLCGR